MTVTVCELENGPVEIVSFPSYKMVIFQFAMLVSQRVCSSKNEKSTKLKDQLLPIQSVGDIPTWRHGVPLQTAAAGKRDLARCREAFSKKIMA